MRKSTRQELRKCRELLHFLLRGKLCFFCKTALHTNGSYAKDGDGQGSPIARNITIHHIDLDHDNDAESNKALAHSACHRSFHLMLRWALQNERFKGEENAVAWAIKQVQKRVDAGKL